jgi:nitroreductase
MDIKEAFQKRRSIRCFLPDLPPRGLIMEILEDAHAAPSGSNMQPWDFAVVRGANLAALRQELLRLHRQHPAAYPSSGTKEDPVPAQIWRRRKELGQSMKELAAKLGKEHMTFIIEGSLDFYGAPAVILVLTDRTLFSGHLLDIGMAVENLLLSAAARGLGACPIGMLGQYERQIVNLLELGERKRLLLAVALGYADEKSPAGNFKSLRVPLSEVVTWLE